MKRDVISFLWRLAIYFFIVHGNMIKGFYMMDKKNPYTSVKKGVMIALGPSWLEIVPWPFNGERNKLLSHLNVKTNWNWILKLYVLVLFAKKEEKNEPLLIMSLKIYKDLIDVILDKIPPGLPPMKDIQYCIDLVLEVVLHNYRMSP